MINAIGLVIAIPLLAAAVNGFFGRRLGRWTGWLATLAMVAAFVIAAGALLQMLSLPVDERTQIVTVADWITAGATSVSLNLRVDPLSITMVMVVTLVGSLIHLYAIGYMEHDSRPWRFFAYTNLFCAFMLTLGPRERLPAAVPGLGRRRAVFLPVDRVLVRPSRGRPSRQEGIHHDARGRCALDAGVVRDLRALRVVLVRRGAGQRGVVAGDRGGHRDRDLAALAGWCRRQVGATTPARVVARRHGRSHAGVGPDPRRDDGDRRRLPGGAHPRAVRDLRRRARRRARSWASPVRSTAVCPRSGSTT